MKTKKWTIEIEWEPEFPDRQSEPSMPLDVLVEAFGKQLGTQEFKRIELKEE